MQSDWAQLLAGVDLVALDGGDVDLAKFALARLAPGFVEQLERQVKSGQTAYIGRSAGAIVGGKSLLTYEPNPNVTLDITQCDLTN